MKLQPISNFTIVESVYGKFILSRHCQYHAEQMIKTGLTHIPHEIDKLTVILNTLPEGCIIIDGGTNIGMYAVPMARAVEEKKGKVYGFEVQKRLYYALCGTIALNDLESLDVFNYGLGDKIDTLKIQKVDYSVPWDYGCLSLVNQEGISQQEFETVDIVTVDSLELERLDFFKIDVEGMELKVLDGGRETITKHRPYFWIEFYNVDRAELKAWFDGMDYTIYQVSGADILCAPNEKVRASGLQLNYPLF
jgi:FkbM family methyltransferase